MAADVAGSGDWLLMGRDHHIYLLRVLPNPMHSPYNFQDCLKKSVPSLHGVPGSKASTGSTWPMDKTDGGAKTFSGVKIGSGQGGKGTIFTLLMCKAQLCIQHEQIGRGCVVLKVSWWSSWDKHV